jgi:MOSC domain-containing protein YiiM
MNTTDLDTWLGRIPMFEGRLIAIFLGARKREDLRPVERVDAVPGRGLVGDRYVLKQGTFSAKDGPDREVTLIEAEALDALAREYEVTLQPVKTRRNLLTRGVPLNHLVSRSFKVGAVILRGIRLCEPCGYLERLTSKGVKTGLAHRGGLRAQIVQGGILEVGCSITPHDA